MENEALLKILANPADAKFAYSLNLNALVNEYPQSGLLRALLAANGDGQYVKHAAVHFNPSALYKVVKNPEGLAVVTSGQIIKVDKPVVIAAGPVAGILPADFTQSLPLAEDFIRPAENENIYPPDLHEEKPVTDTALVAELALPADFQTADVVEEDPEVNEVPAAEILLPADFQTADVIESVTEAAGAEYETSYTNFGAENTVTTQPGTAHFPTAEAADVEQDLAAIEIIPENQPYAGHDAQNEQDTAEMEEIAPAITTTSQTEAENPNDDAAIEALQSAYFTEDEIPGENAEPFTVERPAYFHQPIDDDVFDEIVSIEDINLEQLAAYNNETATDHFVFEPGFEQQEEPVSAASQISFAAADEPVRAADQVSVPIEVETADTFASETQEVSKYNDDKLPYTFMWWLDKTRREHAAQYQPYVSNVPFINTYVGVKANKKKEQIDELQQQYVENIFNDNAILELERSTATKIDENSPATKEDEIISRFIQAEPHIKNTTNTKLDNENKAKKSSEDAEDFVTETLARIYTEQMLYQKAILAYKKLMLKFPEKSLYFASQIEQLQKKPN